MNCYKDSVTGLSLSFSCQNPPEVALPFTFMMFAVCDLAVWYVFRKDELGKLSDVTSRFTVVASIVESAQYGMSTNVNIVAGSERVSRRSCNKASTMFW